MQVSTAARPRLVRAISSLSEAEPPAIVGDRVELQLLTTLSCNLKCTYCSLGVGNVLGSQAQVRYGLDQLEAFVERHLRGKEVSVTFYGGEPTLNPEAIVAVMERFPWFRFQIQTNGTLLDTLSEAILGKLSNVLVSVDGSEATTDACRGLGVYRRVLANLRRVRSLIGGTVTARVTWGNPETTFEELDRLVMGEGVFDYLYFQFVTGDCYGNQGLVARKAVIRQLVDRFFSRTAELYPVIPLMGIVRNKVFPNRATELCAGHTQCRASTHLINVLPDGRIFPCPDLLYDPAMQMGDIAGNWLKRSPLQPTPAMPCAECEAAAWCRGNCMRSLHVGYVLGDQDHRRNVVEPICELIRFLGREIDGHDPRRWLAQVPVSVRRRLLDNEVYEYVEVMP